MDIQSNHISKLTSAKNRYISEVEILSKKLDYGDDIECSLNKLFLASRLINRLDCYCFENKRLATTETLSTFTIDVFDTLSEAQVYSLAINGDYLAQYISDGYINLSTVFENLLKIAKLTYEVIEQDGYKTFNITANCDSIDLFFKKTSVSGPEYVVINASVIGVCSTSCCHNCIKNSDLREMYAVLDQLLS